MANALLDDSTQGLGEAPPNNTTSVETSRRSTSRTVPPAHIQSPIKSPLLVSLPQPQRSNVLAPKSTNMRIQGKGSKKTPKLQISNPMPQMSNIKSVQPKSGSSARNLQTTRLSQDASRTHKTITSHGAADLNMKISPTKQEVNQLDNNVTPSSQTSQSTSKASENLRSRSLYKGKEVLVRAKRAISERLSMSENRKIGHRRLDDSSLDELGDLPYKIESDLSQQRLKRRIAEGDNLSNSKIGSLTGDSDIRGKSLPVYESMASLGRQSSSSDDPFLDDAGSNDTRLSPQIHAFDVDLSRRWGNRHSTLEPLLPRERESSSQEFSDTSIMSRPRPVSRFSSLVSGLTQHPDTEFFSSSPVGFSTPRVRLEPHINTGGKKRLSAISTCSPSILDFSFEQLGDDNLDELQRVPSRARSPSLSLKRKTGRANLRGDLSPVSKKNKGVKTRQEIDLTSGLAQLEATGNGTLRVRDAYKRLKNATTAGSRTKGLKIFDVDKGKQPVREAMDGSKTLRSLPIETQSFNSRPTTRHRRNQPSWSSMIVGSTIDEEDVSTDELQMDRNA